MKAVDLIIPGPIGQLTGGYIYDRRIFEELGTLGWTTTVHALDASFPEPTPAALAAAGEALDPIPDGRLVVIDGLALAGLEPLLDAVRQRLHPVALIHHPLDLESGLDSETKARLKAREIAALARVDRVVVTSSWTRTLLADYGVEPDRIDVVEPGVDRPDSVTARTPGRTLRLLAVGSVTPRKGHDRLIDALGRLTDRHWTLRCAGSLDRDVGAARSLEAQIARLGLGDRVALLGEMTPERVTTEYENADLFVLASRLEGYGMVIAEAVAHGLPVVSTAAGAVRDTLPEGAGFLVDEDDVAGLAKELGRVMDDRELLENLASRARAAAATIPTWRGSAQCFAAVLGRLVR